MSYLKEIYEILQLCLRILSKLYGNYGIFFRGVLRVTPPTKSILLSVVFAAVLRNYR